MGSTSAPSALIRSIAWSSIDTWIGQFCAPALTNRNLYLLPCEHNSMQVCETRAGRFPRLLLLISADQWTWMMLRAKANNFPRNLIMMCHDWQGKENSHGQCYSDMENERMEPAPWSTYGYELTNLGSKGNEQVKNLLKNLSGPAHVMSKYCGWLNSAYIYLLAKTVYAISLHDQNIFQLSPYICVPEQNYTFSVYIRFSILCQSIKNY